MRTNPLPGKPADPIVFGPEYDPRLDPKSFRFASRQAASPAALATQRDGMPVVSILDEGALIVGRGGSGKTRAAAVMRQLVLAGRKKGLAIDIEDGKLGLQRAPVQDFTRSPHPQSDN